VNRPRTAALLAISTVGLFAAGCGDNGQQVESRGADLFAERCGGCHTLAAAGTEGSNPEERIAGPNLNARRETRDQVLFAIRNGGFSGAIMPQNIVVGEDADAVAQFVAQNAGKDAKAPPGLRQTGTGGSAQGSTGESAQK
jgi:mono/diheme cytochrome c family protein